MSVGTRIVTAIGAGPTGDGTGIQTITGAGALTTTEDGGIITYMAGSGHRDGDGDTHGSLGAIQAATLAGTRYRRAFITGKVWQLCG